jgi:hypothetical protein
MGYDVLTLYVDFFGGDPSFSAAIDITNIEILDNGIDSVDEGPSDSKLSLILTFETPLNSVTIGSSDTFDWNANFFGAILTAYYPNQFLSGTGVVLATGAPEPGTAVSLLTGMLLLPCSLAFRKRLVNTMVTDRAA